MCSFVSCSKVAHSLKWKEEYLWFYLALLSSLTVCSVGVKAIVVYVQLQYNLYILAVHWFAVMASYLVCHSSSIQLDATASVIFLVRKLSIIWAWHVLWSEAHQAIKILTKRLFILFCRVLRRQRRWNQTRWRQKWDVKDGKQDGEANQLQIHTV